MGRELEELSDSNAGLAPGKETGKEEGWGGCLLDCSTVLIKVWQGVLKLQLPVRGLQSPEEWASVSTPAVLTHWLGADCVMDIREQRLGPSVSYSLPSEI